MIGEIWSEENPNTYFPRYRGYVALQSTRELSVIQTKYLQNVAYLRLKNLQIGYNIPKNILAATKMQAARIYLSADVPKGNYADMTTRGWEISLSWHDNFTLANKPFNYDIRFTLADYTSKIDKYNNPEKNLDSYYEGMTVGELS